MTTRKMKVAGQKTRGPDDPGAVLGRLIQKKSEEKNLNNRVSNVRLGLDNIEDRGEASPRDKASDTGKTLIEKKLPTYTRKESF